MSKQSAIVAREAVNDGASAPSAMMVAAIEVALRPTMSWAGIAAYLRHVAKLLEDPDHGAAVRAQMRKTDGADSPSSTTGSDK